MEMLNAHDHLTASAVFIMSLIDYFNQAGCILMIWYTYIAINIHVGILYCMSEPFVGRLLTIDSLPR